MRDERVSEWEKSLRDGQREVEHWFAGRRTYYILNAMAFTWSSSTYVVPLLACVRIVQSSAYMRTNTFSRLQWAYVHHLYIWYILHGIFMKEDFRSDGLAQTQHSHTHTCTHTHSQSGAYINENKTSFWNSFTGHILIQRELRFSSHTAWQCIAGEIKQE